MKPTHDGIFKAKEVYIQLSFERYKGKFKKSKKGCKDQESIQSIPHLNQDTNGKVTNSQLDTTNESKEVSLCQAGDRKAHMNKRAQRHSKHKTETNIKDPQKKYWRAFTSL